MKILLKPAKNQTFSKNLKKIKKSYEICLTNHNYFFALSLQNWLIMLL